MAVKLFIVGLPGSGKSEVARNIDKHAKGKFWPGSDNRWRAKRFNDYPILDEMSKDETEGKFFRRLEPRGFNVLEIEAFDIALQRMEQRITNYISSAKKEEIILIEFARNDYWRAFRQFNKSFLQDAYFIYLGAEVEVCKQRICDRAGEPMYPDDDYPVSDYIFEKYYHSDDRRALSSILQDVFGVDTQRVLMLNNNYSLEAALKEIEPFIDFIINRETAHHRTAEELAVTN
jgi:adenylate kinase family enzyme